MDCLFIITASEDHFVSLRFLFIEQFTVNSPALKITVGDGHDPSVQSTVLHVVTYNEYLPVSFREYVTSRSSMMWITQRVLAPRGHLVSLTHGYYHGNQMMDAIVREIEPNGKFVDVLNKCAYPLLNKCADPLLRRMRLVVRTALVPGALL